MTYEDPIEAALREISRRNFLTKSAVFGGALASGGLLAACGSDNKKSSGSGAGQASSKSVTHTDPTGSPSGSWCTVWRSQTERARSGSTART